VKVFETAELGLKFTRRLDAEVVDFQFLSEDYRKMVFLQNDRTVEFHSQGGRHHRMRVPSYGRSLTFSSRSAELFIVGASPEIYRLDLEHGVFTEPLVSECEELDCCCVNPVLPLMAVGGSGGVVECWSLNEGKSIARLQVTQPSDSDQNEDFVTAAQFSQDGMKLACGTSSGIVRIFDIRSRKPLSQRDHRNGFPIKSVQFISPSSICSSRSNQSATGGAMIASCDCNGAKIWAAETGAMIANIESTAPINGLCVYPDSGLIFLPCDQERVGVYFVPALGLAPRWCSFLDSLTEELEETTEPTVYDDYQFLTRPQLEGLGLAHLVGTPTLKPYMHGFFIDARLYKKIKAVCEPFAAEEYRKKKVQEKLDGKRQMRIQIKHKIPKVNSALAKQLHTTAADGDAKFGSKKKRKAAEIANAVLNDNRFSALFSNPDFSIENVSLD